MEQSWVASLFLRFLMTRGVCGQEGETASGMLPETEEPTGTGRGMRSYKRGGRGYGRGHSKRGGLHSAQLTGRGKHLISTSTCPVLLRWLQSYIPAASCAKDNCLQFNADACMLHAGEHI